MASLRQLRDRARDLNIPGHARMSKDELVWNIAAYEQYDARDNGEKSYAAGVAEMRRRRERTTQ